LPFFSALVVAKKEKKVVDGGHEGDLGEQYVITTLMCTVYVHESVVKEVAIQRRLAKLEKSMGVHR